MDNVTWSIISTVLGVIFLLWDVYQFASIRKEKERRTSQVKIWQQSSFGVSNALYRIAYDADLGKFSSVTDIKNAIWAVNSSASALQQSLYEERALTEEEYKEEQKAIRKMLNEQTRNQIQLSQEPQLPQKNEKNSIR